MFTKYIVCSYVETKENIFCVRIVGHCYYRFQALSTCRLFNAR